MCEQPRGCSHIFFVSTGFDKIPYRKKGNLVKICRLFFHIFRILSLLEQFCLIFRKNIKIFRSPPDAGIQPVVHHFGNLKTAVLNSNFRRQHMKRTNQREIFPKKFCKQDTSCPNYPISYPTESNGKGVKA